MCSRSSGRPADRSHGNDGWEANLLRLRQRDRLERECAGIHALVVADDVGQFAFRDPGGIADLGHRDSFNNTSLDGLDLRGLAYDPDLVELPVALDQQDAVAAAAQRLRLNDPARQ